MREEEVIVLVFSMIIFAGAGLMVAAMWTRRRMREMTHRERLAMIDRGLIPSVDGDPMRLDPVRRTVRYDPERGVRFRTAGVLMIGLGLGLTVLIAFTAGAVDVGMGIGGAFAILGFASLLNYLLIARNTEDPYARWTPPPSRGPQPPSGPDTPSV